MLRDNHFTTRITSTQNMGMCHPVVIPRSCSHWCEIPSSQFTLDVNLLSSSRQQKPTVLRNDFKCVNDNGVALDEAMLDIL